MCKVMIGTREAKDIIDMNNGIRIGRVVVCKSYKGGYRILKNGNEVMKTKKVHVALDWLVENGYLHETRFRLTAEQKDILRQRIWEYIGCTIISSVVFTMGLVLTMMWLF